MHVGIDISQSAFTGSGVARYTTSLVHSITELDTKNTYTFLYSSLRRSVPEKIIKAIKKPHRLIRLYLPPTFLSFLWNNVHLLPVETFTGGVDIFLSSDWAQPPVRRAKSVTVVHDLVSYVYPETLTTSTQLDIRHAQVKANIVATQSKRLGWVKKEADLIIADSHSTRDDLISILNIPSDRIRVVYPSVEFYDISENQAASVAKKYDIRRPFILSAGKLEPRKNIQRLIEAFVLSSAFKTADLVIVGAEGWGSQNLTIPDEIQKHIRFLGFVKDQDLFGLYKGCLFFCYPSLYEGFGYPVIEAMAMGAPVATSNVSSLKELAEGYAELFDPHDTQDIIRSLSELLTNSQKRARLSRKALPYAQSFTKKRFAHELLQLFATL